MEGETKGDTAQTQPHKDEIDPIIHQLNSAIAISKHMKEFCQLGASTKQEQIKHLIGVLSPAKLRIRFEILNIGEASIGTAKPAREKYDQHENAHEEDEIETEFGLLDNPEIKIGRVIISKVRTRSDFAFEITFAANGIIFDSDNWNIIVSPVHAFNPQINKNSIIDNFEHYKIYKIRDGTTVNIYHYGGSWCISTANGYEVNDYRWMGSKSYIEAMMEAMSGIDRKILKDSIPTPAEAFKNLNEENCYTMGFRHPDFHPFVADAPGVWMIQAFNRNTGEIVDTAHTEIPPQIEVSAESIVKRAEYPGKDDRDYYRRVFAEISHMNKSAYDVFRSSNSNARKRLNTIESSFNINYGFILRGPFSVCGKYSNIALESALYAKIRQFIYNQPYIAAGDKIGVDYSNRLNYSILRAFLNYPARNTFTTLFPQFDSDYDECKAIIANITDKILKLARYGNTGNTVMSAKNKDKKSGLYDSVAEKLFAHIKANDPNFGKGGRYDPNIKKIISDYVCNTAYTDIYFMIMQARDD